MAINPAIPGSAGTKNALNQLLLAGALLASSLLGGCSLLPGQAEGEGTVATNAGEAILTEETYVREIKVEPPSRPFPQQSLYNLLLAEFAVTNEEIPLALEKYLAEAYASRDPGVIERAVHIALYARNPAAAISAAELWHELQPENEKAASLLAELLARDGRVNDALSVLETQLGYQQQANFSLLESAKFRDGDDGLPHILARIASLRETYPQNVGLLRAQSKLLQKQGDYTQALERVQTLKLIAPEESEAIFIETQLLEQLGENEKAAANLRIILRDYPEEKRFRLHYARLLTNFDLPGAQAEFETLLQDNPEDAELLLSHAAIAYENKDFSAAQTSLDTLLTLGKRPNPAHYYLGIIAREQGRLTEALAHFSLVGSGKYLVSSLSEAGEIIIEQSNVEALHNYLDTARNKFPGQIANIYLVEASILKDSKLYSDAHRILGRAIKELPGNYYLRLERSLLSEKLDLVDMAIEDLEFVLSREPDNVIALNALGYTLADRTDRYDEALALIKKAIAQKPEDGAIIDSLGWVQFKLGDIDAAIPNLEKAYAIFPDDEVAAHLVEAYWVKGDKRKAKKIIRQMRKRDAELPKTNAALQRLGINY